MYFSIQLDSLVIFIKEKIKYFKKNYRGFHIIIGTLNVRKIMNRRSLRKKFKVEDKNKK